MKLGEQNFSMKIFVTRKNSLTSMLLCIIIEKMCKEISFWNEMWHSSRNIENRLFLHGINIKLNNKCSQVETS